MAFRSFGFLNLLLWRKRRAEKIREWEKKKGLCNSLCALRSWEAELSPGSDSMCVPYISDGHIISCDHVSTNVISASVC